LQPGFLQRPVLSVAGVRFTRFPRFLCTRASSPRLMPEHRPEILCGGAFARLLDQPLVPVRQMFAHARQSRVALARDECVDDSRVFDGNAEAPRP
jgi:hypothetical protein